MKRLGLLVVALLVATRALAQDGERNGFAVGWDLNSVANNYGVALRLSSPPFADDKVHVDVAGGISWVQGVRLGSTGTTWASYGMFRVGVFRTQAIGELPLRFYGGGGAVMLLPSDRLSAKSTRWGGYGVTGLELFMPSAKNTAWFAELGGMGTGAKADKLADAPIYANCFTIGWGFRYYW